MEQIQSSILIDTQVTLTLSSNNLRSDYSFIAKINKWNLLVYGNKTKYWCDSNDLVIFRLAENYVF